MPRLTQADWNNNEFLLKVHELARSEGYHPLYILSKFKPYTSAHFICELHGAQKAHQIPPRIWQKLCDHYRAYRQRPYRRVGAEEKSILFKTKAVVFIGGKVTDQIIRTKFLREHFPTAQRLYQYLNWTIRISEVANVSAVMEGQDGRRILLSNVELHDRGGRDLYAVSTPNDVSGHKIPDWQLAALMTAEKLTKMLGIDVGDLPLGVRATSPQFEEYRALMASTEQMKEYKQRIKDLDARRKPFRYSHLKCIQTTQRELFKKRLHSPEFTLTVTADEMYEAVRKALCDDEVSLIPIVSIVSRKSKEHRHRIEDFSVDFMLPVQLDAQNWVGIVYRNFERAVALLDRYDILNKAILCDPSFQVIRLRWFKNNFDRLKVIPKVEPNGHDIENVLGLTRAPGHAVIPEVASMQQIPTHSAAHRSNENMNPNQNMNRNMNQNMNGNMNRNAMANQLRAQMEAQMLMQRQFMMQRQCMMMMQNQLMMQSRALMQYQAMMQRQSMMQCQAMMHRHPSRSQSMVSAEAPHETPALPVSVANPNAAADHDLSAEEMDKYLGLAPKPNDQRWNHQMAMMQHNGYYGMAAHGAM